MKNGKKQNGFKNGKNAEKNATEIKGLIMSKEEFNRILGTGGSKNNYKELVEELKKYRDMGAYAKVYSFRELSELTGCKASDGAARNVQQYIKENMQDLVKKVTVSTQEKLIGFVLK